MTTMIAGWTPLAQFLGCWVLGLCAAVCIFVLIHWLKDNLGPRPRLCEDCKRERMLEAYHDSNSPSFVAEVVWICRDCRQRRNS